MNGRQMLLGAALALSLTSPAYAGSATWKTSPGSNDWKTAANWSPATVPNADTDIAKFGSSSTTDVSISSNVEVGGIVFNQGASAFTIAVSGVTDFDLHGDITNNSGLTQNLLNAATAEGFGDTIFFGNATIGDGIVITNQKEFTLNDSGGFTRFVESSNAGNATIVNESNAFTDFYEATSAANATIINEGGAVRGEAGAYTLFSSSRILTVTPTAGNATIVNNAGVVPGAEGSFTSFIGRATAGNATLIANGRGADGGKGGSIRFYARTTGGTSRVEVFGNGSLDISGHARYRVTVGSVEGDGLVFLGQNELREGSNGLDTVFSGVIQDGGSAGGVGGSLAKIGSGTLRLKRANTYTGGTAVRSGVLLIDNGAGSGTGSGSVSVNGGGLGGNGVIAGPVTIGDGSKVAAFLTGGNSKAQPGTLTIQSAVTFNSDGTLKVNLATKAVKADEVIANGATIKAGAQFTFVPLGQSKLPGGTVFTILSNTAATPISGTFANLADGSTFTSNGNTYQANYEGGDGNDLTLTVQ